jgi:hypothetical protein
MYSHFRLVSFLFLTALCGCGSADRLYPVTGTVKYADGTVPQGEVKVIRFEPIGAGAEAATPSPASGSWDADGKFSLSSKKINDGVRAGNYKVTFTVLRQYGGKESLVAEKFTTAATTPLECKVEPSGKKHFDFVIER